MNLKDRRINILILEDADDDVELMIDQLEKHKFSFDAATVKSRDDYVYQLNHFRPDIILADYTLPGFNGIEALKITQAQKPNVPFIFVTGTLEVERAVETILEGADNFILKDNLPSLPGAVYRALDAADERYRRIEAERVLRQSEEQFNKLFHANPVPASVTQLVSDKVVDVNQALLDSIDFRRSELEQNAQLYRDLWQEPGDKQRIVQRLKEGHPVRGYKASLATKSGDIRTFLISAELIELSGEKCVLAMYFDDTERQLTIREMQEQHEALTRSNTELERFAYITSHDLRAPVVNICEIIDMYDTENPDAELNQSLIAKLEKSGHQLNNTLNTLIEVVALKDRTAIHTEEISWRGALDDVLLSISQQVKNNNAQLSVDFSKAPKVLANRDYIHSILLNLLTNAIRYKQDEKPPVIQITTYHEGDNTVLSVRDEGIGINLEKYQEKIFRLYQQFSPQKKGKGLGLYIVKNQLERMGGHIQVNSRLNEFTEFRCYFPNK